MNLQDFSDMFFQSTDLGADISEMILFCAAAVVLVAVLVYYLLGEAITEKSFTVHSTLSRGVIFDFLKSPTNLERIHPKIHKVLDIQNENSSSTSFRIEDDMGTLFGKRMFQMTLSTSCDVSSLTSSIRLNLKKSVADVTVTLVINDYQPGLPVSKLRKVLSPGSPLAIIDGRIKVKAMRILNFMICIYLISVWSKTVRAALDILIDESRILNHKKAS